QALSRGRGELSLDVDAVADGSGDLVGVAPPHERRALAALPQRSVVTTRTRVRREDELEACRERGGLGGARHHDDTALEGLAQRLEDVDGELRRFVEEQDAVVG